VPLAQIGQKKNKRFASSFDVHHNSLQVSRMSRCVRTSFSNTRLQLGDQVTVVDGPFKERRGVVKHLFRYFAFVHSKEVIENNGLFACRTGQLFLQGGRNGAVGGGSQMAPTANKLGACVVRLTRAFTRVRRRHGGADVATTIREQRAPQAGQHQHARCRDGSGALCARARMCTCNA
jgi:hypothetical protein